jgi:hypothetical protein
VNESRLIARTGLRLERLADVAHGLDSGRGACSSVGVALNRREVSNEAGKRAIVIETGKAKHDDEGGEVD